MLFVQDNQDGAVTPQVRQSMLGSQRDGVLQKNAVFDESGLVTLPDNTSSVEASTLPCAAVTGWNCPFGVKDRAIQAGEILPTQGTGGVSLFATQFAIALGATVLSSTSSVEKENYLKFLGVSHVSNYNNDSDWGETAKSLTPDGLGVHHIDEVGAETSIPQSMQAIRPEGVVSLVGFLGGKPGNPTSFSTIQNQNCIVRGYQCRFAEIVWRNE